MPAWLGPIFTTLGLALLYLGGVMRSDQHDLFHHWLEDIWVRSDDQRRRGLAVHLAMARGTMKTAGRLIEELFGKKLFSFRSFSCATYLSIAAATAYMLCMSALPFIEAAWNPFLATSLMFGLCMAALGTTHGLLSKSFLALCWALSFLAIAWFLAPIQMPQEVPRVSVVLFVLGIGVLGDLLFIGCMRTLVIIAASRHRLLDVVGIAVSIFSLAVVLWIAPPVLLELFSMDGRDFYGTTLEALAFLVPMTNFFDVLLAIGLLALWASVILNQLIWPIINNVLYVVATERVLKRRGWLIWLGLFLLAAGVPGIAPQIGKIRQVLLP